MSSKGSLSDAQRQAAVALFETGYGRDAVATHLGLALPPVRALHDRWRIWGVRVLMPTATRQTYSFACKREVVQRFLAGETKVALAQEYQLSSPKLVGVWVGIWRRQGDDGLRPKPTGRPRLREPEGELERLQQENERLRAEVAYLGKLRALTTRTHG